MPYEPARDGAIVPPHVFQFLTAPERHATYKDRRPIHYGSGWNLDPRRTYAVWDKGFRAFLTAPSELDRILGELR